MNLKDFAAHHGMKIMSHPSVMRFMQDDKVMQAMMSAITLPARASNAISEHTNRFAHAMSFATEQEVRDLRRTVRSLEDQLAEIKQEMEQSRAKADAK